MDIFDENVPLAEAPEELEIPEEEVPLADVPKTGDLSNGWYGALVLSAAGLVCLTALERRKRDEEN